MGDAAAGPGDLESWSVRAASELHHLSALPPPNLQKPKDILVNLNPVVYLDLDLHLTPFTPTSCSTSAVFAVDIISPLLATGWRLHVALVISRSGLPAGCGQSEACR